MANNAARRSRRMLCPVISALVASPADDEFMICEPGKPTGRPADFCRMQQRRELSTWNKRHDCHRNLQIHSIIASAAVSHNGKDTHSQLQPAVTDADKRGRISSSVDAQQRIDRPCSPR
jgi:hypothetical protein